MFGIVRRKSRSQLVRQELGQSVEHFKQAATHAAQGTSATVGPKINAARDRVQPATERVKDAASTGWDSAVATLTPLATAAGDNIRKTDKRARKVAVMKQKKLQKSTAKAVDRARGRSPRRRGRLAGLLVAGAAIGVAGAYLARKRNAAQWDEYDPSRPVGSPAQVGTQPKDHVVFEPAEPAGTRTFAAPKPSPAVVPPKPAGVAPKPTVVPPKPPTGSTPTGTASTGSTATGATATGAATTGSAAVKGDQTAPLASDTVQDQTSSALHSPKVARMAGGSTKS